MKKFIVLYYAPVTFGEQMEDRSGEDMDKGMEEWMAWAGKCGEHLLDMGTPLANAVTLKPDGSAETSTKRVVGYSVMQGDNREQVQELLNGHPHLAWDAECEIDLQECMPLPGS